MKGDPCPLDMAISIACNAHAGQVDKNGEPYILHPLRVMLRVEPESRIPAVLHDVLEDAPDNWTADDLRDQGFSSDDVDTVLTLTHRKGESYEDYIERIAMNVRARDIKLADLRDNTDLRRIPQWTEDAVKRFQKYKTAIRRLKFDASIL